jgi:hypothetical protein
MLQCCKSNTLAPMTTTGLPRRIGDAMEEYGHAPRLGERTKKI